MGRNRSFDEQDVIARAATRFLDTGYEGSSIDDLVRATGLHRGSLYKAFGSKRGLFLTALRQTEGTGRLTEHDIDLLLVALLELAPTDDEVRATSQAILAGIGTEDLATIVGNRLLERARIETRRRPG